MTKRLNGEGSLRHRPDGRWECRIMEGYRDDGKPNFKFFYGKTQKDVRAKVKEYKEARASGVEMGLKYTFGEWADIWFSHHKETITEMYQFRSTCGGVQ